jgi:hypothetical protein
VNAVDLAQGPQTFDVEIGTIILATGYELTRADAKKEYGGGQLPNVVDALVVERLLAPTGPYGHFLRPGDGKEPGSIAWLEITDMCNMHCKGCYRQRLTGHKPLEQVKQEILFLKRWRNPDNVSIAGGELLIHPEIVEIVDFIAKQGIKPIILTNARALTPGFLRELKGAGLAGFTVQSVGIIQAPDLLPDGRADMRDSCPDMTVYDGKLINSCRIDEYRLFGGFLSVLDRSCAKGTEEREAL